MFDKLKDMMEKFKGSRFKDLKDRTPEEKEAAKKRRKQALEQMKRGGKRQEDK